MKQYKIRKGSIAWHILRIKKPFEILIMTTAIMIVFTAMSAAAEDDLNDFKALHNIEEGIKKVEKVAEMPRTWNVPIKQDLQNHISDLCAAYNIQPELVLAVIEKESNFDAAAMGDSGRSYGLMQIQKRWHKERMEKLNCNDLLDPFQNVTVGIDILAEKLEKYETTGEALTAYNAGDSGAYKHYFSKGIYENSYAAEIMARAEELKEGEL